MGQRTAEHTHVLFVEDDDVIREATQLALERDGFVVTAMPDGLSGLEAFRADRPDIALLDVMVPGLDGVSLCRRIRDESTIPVIMLSARADSIDVVMGLESGADDYVTKPFDGAVLVARIRAVLRRFGHAGGTAPGPGGTGTGAGAGTGAGSGTGFGAVQNTGFGVQGGTGFTAVGAPGGDPTQGGPAGQTASAGHAGRGGQGAHPDHIASGLPDRLTATSAGHRGVLRFGDLWIDTEGMEVRRGGRQVALTPTEMRLLLEFSLAPGTVLSRDKLLQRVWDYGWGGDTRVVDVHVQRLRTKIGQDRIETVRGFGYKLKA